MGEQTPVERHQRWSRDWFASLPWTTIVRRSVAILIAVALSLGTLGLFGFQVCRDALATVGTQAIVRMCGPASLTDLAPWALIIALLLAPEFTRLDFFGVVSLHRTVKEQVRRQEQLASDLFQVKTAVSQNVRVENQIIMAPEPREALGALNDKASRFLQQTPGPLAFAFAPSKLDRQARPVRAQMESQLLRLWEDIQAYIDYVSEPSSAGWVVRPRTTRPSAEPPDPAILGVIADWRGLFWDEIQLVRAARNSVAHAVEISDSDLEEALTVGRRLLDVLTQKLEQARNRIAARRSSRRTRPSS